MEELKFILAAGICIVGVICLSGIQHWRKHAAKAYFLLGRFSEGQKDICCWAYSKAIMLGYYKAWRYYAMSAIDKFMDIRPRTVYTRYGVKCIVNYYYVPDRLLRYATEMDVRRHNEVILFKMGICGSAPLFISYVCEDLDVAWESMLVFMPCSTEQKYLDRYWELSEKIRSYTGRVIPALDAVEYTGDREARHVQSSVADRSKACVMSNVRLSDKVYGKSVVVFDDVTTTGASIKEFVEALQRKGAYVAVVICLAKSVMMPDMLKVWRQAAKDSRTRPEPLLRRYPGTGIQ